MVEVVTRFKIARVRSPRHLARIKTLRCSIPGCKGQPVDPHHLKCGPEGGGSVVAGDQWAVPLCRYGHHDAAGRDGVHRTGKEAEWWARHGIDPIKWAEHLWAETQAIQKSPKLT